MEKFPHLVHFHFVLYFLEPINTLIDGLLSRNITLRHCKRKSVTRKLHRSLFHIGSQSKYIHSDVHGHYTRSLIYLTRYVEM